MQCCVSGIMPCRTATGQSKVARAWATRLAAAQATCAHIGPERQPCRHSGYIPATQHQSEKNKNISTRLAWRRHLPACASSNCCQQMGCCLNFYRYKETRCLHQPQQLPCLQWCAKELDLERNASGGFRGWLNLIRLHIILM